MIKKSNITIKTIAEELGLSFSTVSKAINNNPLVKESTKKAVTDKCAELGYTPNAIARQLRQKTTKNITVIFNDLQNPILTKIFDTIAKQMLPEYSMNVCDSQFDMQIEKAHIQNALSTRADIILLEPATINNPNFKLLRNDTDKLILFGPPNNEIICNNIQIEYELGGYLATIEMLEQNHSDCAVFTTAKTFPSCNAFLMGIRKAYSEYGLHFDENRIFEMDSAEQPAFRQANMLMSEPQTMPSAYITFCDVMAAGIYKAAHKANLSIPENISVVGHDNYPLSDLVFPKLSTINIPVDRIADSCVKLIKHILSGASGTVRYSFDPTLIKRDSTGPRKNSKGVNSKG